MSLKEHIERLNELEKRLFMKTAVDIGVIAAAYSLDWKAALYIGCSLVLYDCYNGISLNNSRNELIRQEDVQRRFGGGR